MKKNNYEKTREKVLKTELGKKTYKKLTISTIILMLSLLGVAIIMTIFCKYCFTGNDWDKMMMAFNLFPIFYITSLISGATTCFFVGEYNILIKTTKKVYINNKNRR